MTLYLKHIWKCFLFLFIYAIPVISQSTDSSAVYFFPTETPVIPLFQWKNKAADSITFKNTDYNDNDWNIVLAGTLWAHDNLSGKGIQWYRQTVFIPEPIDTLIPIALYQRAIICASELYWDGKLLAKNGTVDTAVPLEKPGLTSQFTFIPLSYLTPGKHIVSLRVSNAHTFSGFMETPLLLGSFQQIISRQHLSETILLLCAGIFLFAAIFTLAVFWGKNAGIAYAAFSGLCLSSAVYLLIDALVHFFPTSLSLYYSIALINDFPWYCMMVLFPIFFLFEFGIPHRKVIAFVLCLLSLVVIVPPRLIMFGVFPVSWLNAFVFFNQANMYSVAVFATLCSVIAVFKRKTGSYLTLLGSIALLGGFFLSFQVQIEYAWAIGLCLLIILLTISLSRQMALQNKKHQVNELKSARLELELLKKHIQPHFLLNSLNSIIAWLEENPKTAAKLVHALAEELRLILDFSKEKLVNLSDELRLCQLHCEVMGLRQDKQYVLETGVVPQNHYVPPLIIHTLVENGLTHGYSGKIGGTFLFTATEDQDTISYTMYNDCVSPCKEIIKTDGTGLRYVKSRLQEAFPGRWNLTAGSKGTGFEICILIRKTK